MTLRSVLHGRRFRDRRHAGRELGAALAERRAEQPVVIGLPRGGVVVAAEVALALDAPLDVVVVRKLGAPFQPEYAIGALGEEGVVVVDDALVDDFGLRGAPLDGIIERERAELHRRSQRFRADLPPRPVAGRTVLLVDDGIATGSTARAAAQTLRARGAARIVLAVPVGPPDVGDRFAGYVDEVVCLERPQDFFAVGQAYEEFAPTGDDEVEELLRAAASRDTGDPPKERATAAAAEPARRLLGGIDLGRVDTHGLRIPVGGGELDGSLSVPPAARGLVVFAHGSGSSRFSPRNVQVALALQGARLATLLFDLLTGREELDRANVFDIDLLAERLVAATRFATAQEPVADLPVGYFGASTGAAAALLAAAQLPDAIGAVVSRGGRPDLAAHGLAAVRAPTLLIVGGEDRVVLELNKQTAARLRCPHRLAVVPGATHLFEEPGALQEVARLATAWFGVHLGDAHEVDGGRA
jgi:putative phosphoribosyl transferase